MDAVFFTTPNEFSFDKEKQVFVFKNSVDELYLQSESKTEDLTWQQIYFVFKENAKDSVKIFDFYHLDNFYIIDKTKYWHSDTLQSFHLYSNTQYNIKNLSKHSNLHYTIAFKTDSEGKIIENDIYFN